jgi:methylmalonyl-CoA mutase
MTGDATPKAPHVLSEGFPPVDLEAWRAKARAALGDADFEATLVRCTRDGLARGPLMTRADRPAPSPAPPGRLDPLDNRVEIRASDPAEADVFALEALEGGATSVELRIDPAGADGVRIGSLDDLDRALRDVTLEAAPVSLANADTSTAALLPQLWARRATPAAARRGALNLDPLGRLAAGSAVNVEAELDAAAHLAAAPSTTLRADGRAVHEAGGTEAQELAWAAACGAAYLEALVRRGLAVDAAAHAIAFAVALDADMHLGIAKLRALRRLWARIVSAAGAPDAAASVHAFSSGRMLKDVDPPTNLLRLTAAAMAAALGGADSITLAPYAPEPAARARRLSRNIPRLLAEEADLGGLADSTRGSFHHEALTEALASTAWTRFQAVMRARGPAAFVASGRPLAELGA